MQQRCIQYLQASINHHHNVQKSNLEQNTQMKISNLSVKPTCKRRRKSSVIDSQIKSKEEKESKATDPICLKKKRQLKKENHKK